MTTADQLALLTWTVGLLKGLAVGFFVGRTWSRAVVRQALHAHPKLMFLRARLVGELREGNARILRTLQLAKRATRPGRVRRP